MATKYKSTIIPGDPPIHLESAVGADWAHENFALRQEYGGQWIVVVENEVIAAGYDGEKVRSDAAAILEVEPDGICLCGLSKPGSEWGYK